MALPDFKLTLPDGSVFEASGELSYTFDTESNFLFSGLQNSLALYEQYVSGDGGQPGRSDSIKQGVFLGSGAGVHRIEVSFDQYKGSTEQWGSANQSDSALTKLLVLDRAINKQRIDTDSPATLEIGEYSDAGQYNPLTVVIKQANLAYDARDQSSKFRGSMDFWESTSLEEASQSLQRTG